MQQLENVLKKYDTGVAEGGVQIPSFEEHTKKVCVHRCFFFRKKDTAYSFFINFFSNKKNNETSFYILVKTGSREAWSCKYQAQCDPKEIGKYRCKDQDGSIDSCVCLRVGNRETRCKESQTVDIVFSGHIWLP